MFLGRWLLVVVGLVALALAHMPAHAQTVGERFYYYRGERVPLSVNSRLIAVRFGAGVGEAAQRTAVDAAGDVDQYDARAVAPTVGVAFLPLRAGHDPLAAAARLNGRTGVAFATPVYDAGSLQLAETEEFLARFKPEVSQAEIERANSQNGVELARLLASSDRVQVLKPKAGNARSARELANAYVEAGLVEFAEPNFVIRRTGELEGHAPKLGGEPETTAPEGAVTPNDPSFGLEWGLKNTRQFLGALRGADVNATNAWGVTQGASSIRIAVIDEGVDAGHGDLVGKVLAGYNSLNGSNDTTPRVGDYHGTGVAGVVAASSNNAEGIAGMCWFCQILPVKVAERDSGGNWTATFASLASGIDWAWQNGADVLNNSWTMTSQDPSGAVELAILNARFAGRGNKGSTVVFAAGNENKSQVAYPASLNAYVIAVGASNWCDARKTPGTDDCNNNDSSWGSNYGSALDLLAPGEAIYTTCNVGQCSNRSYTYLAGTSVAVPFVSGAVGLLYALNPNLTPDKVQAALQSGAKDLNTLGRDDQTGYGRLDAHRAIASMYNLSVNVTDGKTFARAGITNPYSITYGNPGATAMGATVLRVTLPANTTYVSSSPAFTARGGGVYELNVGTLASNATGTATFRVLVQPGAAGQKITFVASIGGAFPEAKTSDNTATDVTLGVKTEVWLPFIERGK